MIAFLSKFNTNVLTHSESYLGLSSYDGLHTFFESFGAFSTFMLACFILLIHKHQEKAHFHIWLASGLFSIGILEAFHACELISKDFLFFHLGSLLGGFYFSLVWLPEKTISAGKMQVIPFFAIGFAVLSGLLILVYSPFLLSIDSLEVKNLSTVINLTGGSLFTISAIWFIREYKKANKSRTHFFLIFSLLFGSVSFLEGLIPEGQGYWWILHLIEMLAYLSVLIYFFYLLSKLFSQYKKENEDRLNIEHQLTKEKAFIEKTFNNQADTFFIVDRNNNKLIRWNKAFKDISGYTNEEIANLKSPHDLYEGEDLIIVRKAIKRILEEGSAQIEVHLKTKAGLKIPFENLGTLLTDQNDQEQNCYVSVVGRNISERKKAQIDFARLFNRYQAILFAVPGIIVEVNANKCYTWANQAGLDFFGKDVIGKEAAYFFANEQPTYDIVQPLFERDEKVMNLESWQVRQDGESRLLSWCCRTLKDHNGNITGVLSTARDITEEKQAQIALAESERQYKTLIQNIPGVVYRCELKAPWAVQHISDGIFDLTGYLAEDFICREGKNFGDFILKEDLDFVSKEVDDGIALQKPYVIEYRMKHLDQSIHYVYERGQAIYDDDDNPLWLDGVIIDITEKKLVEQRLENSEFKFEQLLDNADIGFIYYDYNYTVLHTNKLMAAYLLTTPKNLIGKTIFDLFDEKIAGNIEERANNLLSFDVGFNEYLDFMHLPTGLKWFLSTYNLVLDVHENILGFQVISHDITNFKETELALQVSEQRYRNLFEKASDGIFIIDIESNNFIDINQNVLTMLKYSKAELLSMSLIDVICEPEYYLNILEGLKLCNSAVYELTLKTKDLETLAVELSSQILYFGDKNVIQSFVRDITERKEVEQALQRSREELEGKVEERTFHLSQAVENNAILTKQLDQLASRIHNSLKNKLDSVRNLLMNYMKINDNIDEPSKELVNSAYNIIAHCSKLAKNILFVLVNKTCTFDQLRSEMEFQAKVLFISLGIHYRFKAHYEDKQQIVTPELTQLILEVYTELLNNIEKHAFANYVDIDISFRPSSTRLRISDDGKGFVLSSVKNKKGSFGLAMVEQLINHNNGFIYYDTEIGRGTTVELEIKS